MRTRQADLPLVNDMASARELLDWAAQQLLATSENPELDSQLLLSEATGLTRTQVRFADAITSAQADEFRQWIARRKNSEPIQYITGRSYFRTLTLHVGPGVLIPRPESEILVELVLERVENLGVVKVLDLGAGSGALAIAIASELSGASVTALEKDALALEWLQKNVIALDTNIEVLHLDVIDFSRPGHFDVVIANPPYIPNTHSLPHEVSAFEPHGALFGGTSGLEIPKLFVEAAARSLKSGGLLAIEHHEEQGEQIREILRESFTRIELHYDLNQHPRFSSGVRK